MLYTRTSFYNGCNWPLFVHVDVVLLHSAPAGPDSGLGPSLLKTITVHLFS